MKSENVNSISYTFSYVSLGVLLLLMTVADLVVVEGIIRPTQAWDLIGRWHTTFIILMYGTSLLLGLAYKKPFTFLFIPFIFLFFGMEDSLYYVLRDLSLPVRYYGVTILGIFEPKLYQVVVINSIGLLVFLISLSRKSLFLTKIDNTLGSGLNL